MRSVVLTSIILGLLGTARGMPGQQLPDNHARDSQRIPLGSRVRIEYSRLGDTVFAPPPIIVGRLVALTDDSVTVRTGTGTRALSLADLARLDRPAGRRTKGGQGVALGAFMGGLAGAVVGLATWKPCTETGWLACFMHPSQGGQMALGAIAGGAVGAVAGLIVGSQIHTDAWAPLAPLDVHVGVGVGAVRFSLRF